MTQYNNNNDTTHNPHWSSPEITEYRSLSWIALCCWVRLICHVAKTSLHCVLFWRCPTQLQCPLALDRISFFIQSCGNVLYLYPLLGSPSINLITFAQTSQSQLFYFCPSISVFNKVLLRSQQRMLLMIRIREQMHVGQNIIYMHCGSHHQRSSLFD